MKATTTIAQMLVRACGVILIVLGVLFWTGHARSLVGIHMLIGIILVLALWTLCVLAARAGVSGGLVALAAIWGLIVVILGVAQSGILPGPAHWVIELAHLLVGLVAIGLAEVLGGRIKRGVALAR